MSASAIKSSMPGVGAAPPTTAHSIIPMNVMAQKVVAGSDSASIKPMSSSGLSYVTLQPANQPLSLVQEHRPSAYQSNSGYSSNISEKEKESEGDKVVQNGVEPAKITAEQVTATVTGPTMMTQTVMAPVIVPPKPQAEGNRNNNLSPENPLQEKPENLEKIDKAGESKTEALPASNTENSVAAPSCPAAPQNKVEEKKTTPIKSKPEPSIISVPAISITKISPHKTQEEPQIRMAEISKLKPVQSTTTTLPSTTKIVESSGSVPASTTAVPPSKTEAKMTNTPRTVKRKSRELKDLKGGSGEGGSKPKRNRVQTQPYQSPLPEIALIVKTLTKPPAPKNADDKLIVFYKNEFLAVRNAEGSFYVCQAMQNIYKSSRRIRIRWLSQDKNNGEIYSPDFYDFTDFDCILTNLNLNKIDKNKFQLTKFELLRTENILKRAIDVEAGVSEKPRVTEEHPDGLDLSLYKDESQLKKRKRAAKEKQRLRGKRPKRDSSSSSSSSSSDEESDKKSSPKPSRVKKRSINKALAIAKSVAKGPNRAKRALNRAAVVASKPIVAASVAGNNSTNSSVEPAKRSAPEANKKIVEPKKIITKQQSSITSAPIRTTKLRAVAPIPESTSIGRAKRIAATVPSIVVPTPEAPSSTEDSSSRKKPRTTRA